MSDMNEILAAIARLDRKIDANFAMTQTMFHALSADVAELAAIVSRHLDSPNAHS